MSEWREVALGDAADLSWGDTSTTKSSYTPAGWPAYSATGPDGLLPHFDHDEDGVVISAIGAQCGKTWLARGRWSCIKNTMFMRGRHEADTTFLFHATRSRNFWPRRGAAQPFISLGDARSTRLALPPPATQRRIAVVLSAFDELIEINERRIGLLEVLASSLYSHLAKRGEHGWQTAPLFDVADVTFGYPFKSKQFSPDGSKPIVRIRDIPRGVASVSTDEQAEERYQVSDGDILIGMDGTFHMRQWSDGDAWLNQRVARLRPRRGFSARHLMLSIAGPINDLNRSIVGTTVAHLGKRHLEEIRVAIPPRDALAEASRGFNNVADLHLNLEKQNRQLAATRDLLLPRLVTGRLDISEVDLGVLEPVEV